MSTNKPQINVRLPEELHSAVKDMAKTQGISLNQFVVDVLSEAVSTVTVPLKAVGNKKTAGYSISIPPEWFFMEPVLCGQQDIYHNTYYCDECSKEANDSAKGCGKRLR